MSRAHWKGSFVSRSVLNKVKKLSKKEIIVRDRNSTIPFFLVGKVALVYNGRILVRVHISREKVGFKFGEFAYTRTRAIQAKKAKKGKKVKK